MNLMITNPARARANATDFATDIILYATSRCAMGEVLVARSSKGVSAILIGDTDDELEQDLAARFPNATILANEIATGGDLAKVVRFMENPAQGLDLILDMRGTTFQRRVWEKLRAIPAGKTVSYMELAKWVGPLVSPRAVGSACAANPIALAIPCHRVVRSNGNFAGYRWGIERKRELLQKEQKGDDSSCRSSFTSLPWWLNQPCVPPSAQCHTSTNGNVATTTSIEDAMLGVCFCTKRSRARCSALAQPIASFS
jgi:AraC family transcriptional regulator, regulatory protein of adaptative response / methylated-DNA-[protein]-cysteine methyltransferase